MLTALISFLVDTSRRFAWLVVGLAVILAGISGWYAVQHFKINTDINQLLSAELPHLKAERALAAAFPQDNDLLVVVIDGDTPDAAEGAATALSEKLQAIPSQFTTVVRPDAIPFFRKEGLFFLPQDQLPIILDQMVQAQPMLGVMTTDPSLRGFFGLIGEMAQGLAFGAVDYSKLKEPLGSTADTVEAALKGADKPLAWADTSGGGKTDPHLLRKFILTQPRLDYGSLEPGKAASNTIRNLVHELQLTPDHGVHVRLTGSVPLNDEEFASVANGTTTATIMSGVLVFLLLMLALHSLRLVLPILLTLTVGLTATTAFALLAIGSLNLISVAFAVMFIGIAVDFGIQFGVRYRDQHFHEPDHAIAMVRTAKIIGVPLAMAAASTALGFLAFIPTDYRGVSELGEIAGAGMVIAFFLNVTLLPALLSIAHPPAERDAVGYAWAAPIDGFLLRHRRGVLLLAGIAAIIGLGITTRLHFDFDPLDLKDPHTESVRTLFDIMKDPDAGFYKIEMLRPTLEAAQDLAAKLEKLPEVDHVMTLASFVPKNQDAKLATITDTRKLLEPTLALPPEQPPGGDDDIYNALHKAASSLHGVEADRPAVGRLASLLDQVVAKHDPEVLQRLHKNIIGALAAKLDVMKGLLGADHITAATISPDLRRDWVSADGQYRLEVFPKGDAHNHARLRAFTAAVKQVAPDATGTAVSIEASGQTVVSAFIHAGIYALLAIALLAFLILRRLGDVIMLLVPLLLAGILTLATMVVVGLPLNFANIIALPLLLSLGVSYAIYFVSFWRSGQTGPLQSSMARAVFFSAATVLVAFGSLAISNHPGTSSMGKLLTIALLYSLTCTFFILPPLLGGPILDKDHLS